MKEIRRYLHAVLPQLILSVLIILFAYYAIGVVERHEVLEKAENRFDIMETELEKNQREQELVLHELRTQYLTSARIAAMMLSGSPDMLKTETGLEELRIALNCSVLAVSDADGKVIYSTAHTNAGEHINDAFVKGLTNKGFSDVVIELSDDSYTILAAATWLDADGVIQLSFPENKLEPLLSTNDASVAMNQLFLESGTLAILNEDLQYISHTNRELVGLTASFSQEELEEESDQFTMRIAGEKQRVMYRRAGEQILLCTLPTSVLYDRRNTVIRWLLLLSAIILTHGILRVHSQLHTPKKQVRPEKSEG